MFIPVWAIVLCLLAFVAWSYLLLMGAWKAGQELGEKIGREDAEIERNTQELREALAPICRHNEIQRLKSLGDEPVIE